MGSVAGGKNVIVEKPYFSNLTEWQQAYDLAEQNDVFIFEAARHIHTENYHYLKQLVAELMVKKQDAFLGANFNIGQYSSRYEKYQAAIKTGESVSNIFNLNLSGGTVMDISIYPLYVAVDLFGRPDQVSYRAVRGPNDVNLFGNILLDFNSSIIDLTISKAVHSVLHNELYIDNQTIIIPNITDIDRVKLIDNKCIESVNFSHPAQTRMVDEAQVFAEILSHTNEKNNQNK